jgi:hypothetical protein
MKQHANNPINELFTAFKIDPTGKVMPTVVFRQMPFSTLSYREISTKFLNLPRWKINTSLIETINIGKEEAARINFVQVFGQTSLIANSGSLIADQIVKQNFDIDAKDIGRSGLRPYVITSNMDFPVSDKELSKAPVWSKLLGDALIGGQNKLNGSITCIGISQPIAPGDNLQLEDTVFHIEGITHECSIGPGGKKSFITNITLSNGVSVDSTQDKLIYSESDYVQMDDKRANDKEKIYPGVTDVQQSLDATGTNRKRNRGGERFKQGPQEAESFTPSKQSNSVQKPKSKNTPDKTGPKGKL